VRIYLKSPEEIRKLREVNLVCSAILDVVCAAAKPGVSTWELDQLAAREIAKHKVKSAFLGYLGYPNVLCTSPNEVVVHGIPRKDVVLKDGDIVGIDFGCFKDGFCGDSARTIAVGRISGELYLVDDRASVIDLYGPQYRDLDLPIVDGLTALESGGTMLDEGRAELAARLIASLQEDVAIAAQLSQVDVADVHNAKVILNDDPAVVFVGRERFLARIRTYLQVAAALRQRVPDIDYVDLRFDDRIYVRPAKGNR